MKHHSTIFLGLGVAAFFAVTGNVLAQETNEVPPWPNDVSVAGLQAAATEFGDSAGLNMMVSVEVRNRIREYVDETQKLGLGSRAGVLSIPGTPLNVQANNNTGDAVGETQAEVAVSVHGDTVVIGWNDSRGFVAGNTVSSYAYSVDGGATFTDGGNMPLQVSTDQAFGDPGVDNDEQGNWYYNSIYTKTGQQNIGVHHGRFVAGALVWDTPVMASIGTSATGLLDKCLIAVDRVTGIVYDSYTRFTAVPRIEIVRSTNFGTTWEAPVVLDATTTPTGSKQASRPFCGPNGEVYVVWEKGANLIQCPDGAGNLASFDGAQIAFTRSLNNGVTYSPFTVIGTLTTDFMASGPGDLRERANEFPDIAVDRSGGQFNGNIYVTWHESAPWTTNVAAGPVKAEADNAGNNNPGGAELFNVGDNVTGSSSSTADLDYWQFSATQGQNLFFNLDPQGFNCGVSGTTRGLRMRLFATQSPYPNPNGFPDTLVAASAQGAFADRIVWTAPKTGTYLVRIQPSTTAIGTYTLRVRNLAFGAPSPARDTRDVVVVRSADAGLTWSAKQLVNDDPAGLENRRPFICVDGLGRVMTFWHDSREPGFGSNAALTSIFGTTSVNGGATWSPNYMVSDELSFFSFNTLAVPNLGDYNQAAGTASGIVHSAWSDQRLSTGDVRTPNTNVFSAGRGPETYTTALLPLSITCPSDITVGTDPGNCSAVVNFTVTATGYPAPTITSSPPSGSTFPLGTTTVTSTASNGADSAVSCTFTVTVADSEPPVITSVSASPAVLWPPNHQMRDVTIDYTATDQCGTVTSVLSVSSNEPDNGTGDGDLSPDWVIVDDHHVQLRAERAGGGAGRVYTITITSTDSTGNVSTTTTTVVVGHNITGPMSGAAFKINSTVKFSGTFWDVAGKTHTARWTLDGITTAGSVVEPSGTKNGTVTGEYIFTSPGVYRVTLNLTDNTGVTSWVNSQGDLDAIVVIYDPTAGYVAGGGWFASPAGAFAGNPASSGKVSFGFMSKYFKSATNPKGETQFRFNAGGFGFDALNYDYLVIAKDRAQFKGLGKGNDGQTYGFILTVSDGQVSGGDGTDKFRMKIYNRQSGAVLYDNQMGASDAAAPTTPVGPGSAIAIVASPASSTGSTISEQPADPQPAAAPERFMLFQNFPNPFNPLTVINYDVPVRSAVTLKVYTALGQEVATLAEGMEEAGRSSAVFDAAGLPSGMYFYKLTAVPAEGGEPFVRVMKTLLIK